MPGETMSFGLGGGLTTMAKLIYSMITSLDGYAAATDGDLGFDAEEEAHTFIDDTFRNVGTYLYGRRMYETMVFWETAHALAGAPPYVVDFARSWQAAAKVVYSTTLTSLASARTRIEPVFDPAAVRSLKDGSDRDLTISGPTLAAQAVRAGLVDEYHLFTTSTVVGGGTGFFPDGVRLDLELVRERSFASGLRYAQYRTRPGS